MGYAPGAEQNALASWAHDTVADRIDASTRRRRDLAVLRAAVALVAQDRRISATLRFDLGQLTIHDGMIGIPDLTLCGDFDDLVALSSRRLSRLGRLPVGDGWRRAGSRLLAGQVKVYGLLGHPRLLLRLLRLLAPYVPPPSRAPGSLTPG